MYMETMSLARQVDLVFRQVRRELACVSSGTVFIQIRNNMVGKFGLRHDPIDTQPGAKIAERKGLSDEQWLAFRNIALEALRHKTDWTHGEIQFEFALRQNVLVASVQFESNYNMAAILPHLRPAR
mgnify:CR=1 FL=1|jgi:hypothetical protein